MKEEMEALERIADELSKVARRIKDNLAAKGGGSRLKVPPMSRADFKRIPYFARGHIFAYASKLWSSTGEYPATPQVDLTPPVEDANLITSQEYLSGMHRPLLDLDWEAELIPSSTPGHYHLYINRLMSWENYKKLLTTMHEVGLLQRGFVDSALELGYTSLRLPHHNKEAEEYE